MGVMAATNSALLPHALIPGSGSFCDWICSGDPHSWVFGEILQETEWGHAH